MLHIFQSYYYLKIRYQNNQQSRRNAKEINIVLTNTTEKMEDYYSTQYILQKSNVTIILKHSFSGERVYIQLPPNLEKPLPDSNIRTEK